MPHTPRNTNVSSSPVVPSPRYWLSRFGLMIGLASIVTLSLAATASQFIPKIRQTHRLEVVNDAGQILVVAHATAQGGRVEVRNTHGEILFSVGADPGDTALPGMWQQTLRKITSQGRELTRQRRTLDSVTRQLLQVEQQNQHLHQTLRLSPDLTGDRHNVEQQRRALDALEREVDQLRRQVQTLDQR